MDTYKVVVVGPSSVGKTTIVNYLNNGKYIPGLEPTVGASFTKYKTKPHGIDTYLDIWDTAGSPRYSSMLPMYMREASAVILVYDASNNQSLYEIESYWVKYLEIEVDNIEKVHNRKVVKYMVGNKSDLIIDYNDSFLIKSQDIANKNGFRHLLASAFSGENVKSIFDEIAIALVEKKSFMTEIRRPLDLDIVEIKETIYENPKPSCSC